MTIELKLKSSNETEDRIMDYLIVNVSDVLAEKINAGAKTLGGAVEYAKTEARKLANGDGCICVDDATVFGWIIHFFEEDSIPERKKRGAAVHVPAGAAKRSKEPAALAHSHDRKPKVKPEAPAKPEKKVKPVEPAKPDPQLTMFEALLGGKP